MSTGVYAKIQQVMQKLGYVQKDKKMQGGGNYTFLSDEKLAGEAHVHMAEVGLVMYPSDMEIVETFEGTTSSGNTMRYVRARVQWTFASAEDGSSITAWVFGEGSDTGDKCLNKVMTAARKYAIRLSFVIATGDDPDDTASESTTKLWESDKTTSKGDTTTEAKGALACEYCGATITQGRATICKQKNPEGKLSCVPCGKGMTEDKPNA